MAHLVLLSSSHVLSLALGQNPLYYIDFYGKAENCFHGLKTHGGEGDFQFSSDASMLVDSLGKIVLVTLHVNKVILCLFTLIYNII